MGLLSRLFPRAIDNCYRGHVAAIWLLVPPAPMKLVIGVNVAGLNPWMSNRTVLEHAEGVPLGSFGANAASQAVFSSATWGLAMAAIRLLVLNRITGTNT